MRALPPAAPGFMLPDWDVPVGVGALLTTREGGLSLPPYDGFNLGAHVGDDPLAVERNRERLRLHLDREPLWLSQVHGVEVADADLATGVPQADAVVARTSARVCAVLTADCLPVLFCDDAAEVVGAAHAGWRGLADGVLEATIARMGVAPQRLRAWLGPAIGPDAFEVGEDVRARFLATDPGAERAFKPGAREGKWLADLFALARRRLQHAGLGRVSGGGVCTFADRQRFYSYRRDGVTGRFASMVWLQQR